MTNLSSPMPTKNQENIYYRLSNILSQSFGEHTRRWAEDEIKARKGDEIERLDEGELRREYDIPSGRMWYNSDDSGWDVFKGDDLHSRGTRALSIALRYRLKQYAILLLFIIVPVVVANIVWNFQWNSIGSCFNILGGIIVARGLFRTPTEIEKSASGTTLGSPIGDAAEKLVSAAETIDAIVGVLLLIIGFLIQYSVDTSLIQGLLLIVAIVAVWAYLNRR